MDQLARVTQTIFDGFESKKPQRPRLTELRARLASERPHLVLLQETKLRAGQEAPTFPGFNVAARQDWAPPPDAGPASDRPAPPTPPTPTCCNGGRDAICSPFSRRELLLAIRKQRKGRCPGVDQVTNDMLHQLSPSAERHLLAVLNWSWRAGEVPASWRATEIVAIPKKGKPPTETGSYRPISLLSCIGKLAERLVQHRLQHWLERAGKLNRNQAGFRKGHSTMDQLAHVTQTIFDGFESKKPQRAVLVLLDYARAYDRVWRDALHKMGRMGAPGCVTSWIRALLSDRHARVRCGTSTSRWRIFQEGLPQGPVRPPPLAGLLQ